VSDNPYIPWTQVEYFLGRGQATTFPLSWGPDGPEVSYEVGHGGHYIALQVQLDRLQRPPQSPLPSIRIDQVAARGLRLARIRTTQVALMRDFHDFLSAIADRILTHGLSLDQAIEETIRSWSTLLNRPHAFGTEKRIGLIGELAVLRSLATEYGWEAAVSAWKGPRNEEHDFGLSDYDVEVKTTASELRTHTIHGITQLVPTPERRLWFVSLQLTRGGTGGRTLAECANGVRSSVSEHTPSLLNLLDEKLASTGWSAGLPDDERWTPRSASLVLDASTVPRLDTSLMSTSGRERISNVQYTLDVTHLPPASPSAPAPLEAFILP
jgi:hypothetical protein